MFNMDLRASDVILMYIFVAPTAIVSAATLRYPWLLWYAVLCALVTLCVVIAYVLHLRMRTRTLIHKLRRSYIKCESLKSYIKDKRAAHYAQHQDVAMGAQDVSR